MIYEISSRFNFRNSFQNPLGQSLGKLPNCLYSPNNSLEDYIVLEFMQRFDNHTIEHQKKSLIKIVEDKLEKDYVPFLRTTLSDRD